MFIYCVLDHEKKCGFPYLANALALAFTDTTVNKWP